MYHKISVYLNEAPEELTQIQRILDRCESAEQDVKYRWSETAHAIALCHLDCSMILLVVKSDAWVDHEFLKGVMDEFSKRLVGYTEAITYKIEEILASEAHQLLQNRPISCGDVPFPTKELKIALENSQNDGVHIEEKYFDLDIPRNEFMRGPDGFDSDNDLYQELLRIEEYQVEKLARCFPVHYALGTDSLENANKAIGILVSALLQYNRVKSRRIFNITIQSESANLDRIVTILKSAKDSICVLHFDRVLDIESQEIQDFLCATAKCIYPRFLDLQFIFIIGSDQVKQFNFLRQYLKAIPILDIDLVLNTVYEDKRSEIDQLLRKAGIENTDLEVHYLRNSAVKSSNPVVDFHKIYSSHVLNAVYPQYSSVFPELRIVGLKSSSSYKDIARLFPLNDLQDEIAALRDLEKLCELKIPTLPPRSNKLQFTYAVVGDKGMGHDTFIHHHMAILHDLGYLKDRHKVYIDQLVLIEQSRERSVIGFLDKFDEADGGALIVNLENLRDDGFKGDPLILLFQLLMSHEVNFAFYLKVSYRDWIDMRRTYPALSFLFHTVIELEPLTPKQAVELFCHEASRLSIFVDADARKIIKDWFEEHQNLANYYNRYTLQFFVRNLRTYRSLWGVQHNLSKEITEKEYKLDSETMQQALLYITDDIDGMGCWENHVYD